MWRALEVAWTAIRVLFYGPDVFISYSHTQTKYAEKLADKLQTSKRRVSSFIDQDASLSGARTPRHLLWNARHSRVLAVVATEAAVQSPQVRTEVRLARRCIVIATKEASEQRAWAHPVWVKARGSTPEWQRAADIENANVDDEVVARINRITGLMRASVRLALLATATLVTVIAGIVLVLWLSDRANREAVRAETEAKRAAASRREALASSLAGRALNLMGTPRHDEGLRLAAASYDTLPEHPSYVTRSALLEALVHLPGLQRIFRPPESLRIGAGTSNPQDVRRIRRLPGGRFAAVMGNGAVRVVDPWRKTIDDLGMAGDITLTLDVSPSGRWIVIAGTDGIRLWDVETRRAVKLTPIPASTARFASEERFLSAQHDEDDSIEVVEWDIHDPEHPRRLRSMPVRPDGIPPTCGDEACPRKGNTKQAVANVSFLDVSPAAGLVAVGFNDGRLAVLDFPAGTLRHCSTDDDQPVWLVRLAPDGSVVVRSSNYVFSVRDARSGTRIYRDCDEPTSDAAFLGNQIVLAASRSIVSLVNGEWKGSIKYPKEILTADFGTDGKTLVAGTRDEAITVWSIPTAGPLEPEPLSFVHSVKVTDTDRLAFSGDGKSLAVGDHRTFQQLVDTRTRKIAALPSRSSNVRVPYATLAPGEAHVIDAVTGDVLWHVPLPRGRKARRAFTSSNGGTVAVALLATNDAPSEVVVWEAGHAVPRQRVTMPSDKFAFALSHDGGVLAIGGDDGVVRLLGAKKARFRADDSIDRLAISPDGATIAASIAGNLKTVLYDASDGLIIGEIPRTANGIAFSPDGTLLALASAHSVELCDLEPGVWRKLALAVVQ